MRNIHIVYVIVIVLLASSTGVLLYLNYFMPTTAEKSDKGVVDTTAQQHETIIKALTHESVLKIAIEEIKGKGKLKTLEKHKITVYNSMPDKRWVVLFRYMPEGVDMGFMVTVNYDGEASFIP